MMGFLIPKDELSIAEIKALKNEISMELLRRASKQTGRNSSEFIVRDIFPYEDFSDSTPAWNGVEWQNQSELNSADAWEQDWYKELPSDKFVAFYGVHDHVQQVAAYGNPTGGPLFGISYRVGSGGATTREQIHLQAIQRHSFLTEGVGKNPIGYHKPVYYDGKETISVYLIGNAGVAQYAEQIELLGMICEPLGNVVSAINVEVNPGNLSVSVPEDELTIDDIRALREETKNRLLDLYVKETGKGRETGVVRDIFPKDDFGFNGVEWQNQTLGVENTWTKDWSKELPKTKFVGFYGIDYKKAVTTFAAWNIMGVRYAVGSSGASTRKQVHIQNSQRNNITGTGSLVSARCYHRPVLYKGTETVYIVFSPLAAVTQYYDQLQLIGLLVEPYGAMISG